MDTEEANVHLGFDPDPREYGIGAQILKDLGITTMRLITNNPVKRAGLQGYGLEITGRIPIEIPANEHNRKYLKTKKTKFGHMLTEFEAVSEQGVDVSVAREVEGSET
jgi:3,4-dihydroxy 2-butanone 4-phosphate synthase/GTP cyclohydrolase II